jgi:hypothetical protein
VTRRTLAALTAALLASQLVARAPARAYEGHLRWVFGDIKRSLAGLEGRITPTTLAPIIDGLRTRLGCNGLRVYIDPGLSSPDDYPPLYRDAVAYAASQGLALYANPLGVGHAGRSPEEFAAFVADYANRFRPRFLGPFNESGFSAPEEVRVVAALRRRLAYRPTLVGPDRMHVRDTISGLERAPGEADLFDVIGAHDAEHDEGATAWAWWRLGQLAGGRPVWATEDPRDWSSASPGGKEVGVKAVVESAGSVAGIVLYLAFPRCVDERGELTDKGRAIARGIGPPTR